MRERSGLKGRNTVLKIRRPIRRLCRVSHMSKRPSVSRAHQARMLRRRNIRRRWCINRCNNINRHRSTFKNLCIKLCRNSSIRQLRVQPRSIRLNRKAEGGMVTIKNRTEAVSSNHVI